MLNHPALAMVSAEDKSTFDDLGKTENALASGASAAAPDCFHRGTLAPLARRYSEACCPALPARCWIHIRKSPKEPEKQLEKRRYLRCHWISIFFWVVAISQEIVLLATVSDKFFRLNRQWFLDD